MDESMDDGNEEWVAVAAADAVPDGGAVRIPSAVAGAEADIALFNDGGRFYALADRCSHGGGSLSEGWLEDGEVECPLHSGRFCLRTGEALEPPVVVDAPVHQTRSEGGQVWIRARNGRAAS